MTQINALLSRALLLEEPRTPRDIVPCTDRCTPSPQNADSSWPVPGTPARTQAHAAAHDLQTLCETVVTHTAATSLQDFLTEQLPEPSGARVLGCILQLTDAEDGARTWWQYAAGAGDDAASYCLYLHHLSLGDADAAAWWREQTRVNTAPAPETVAVQHEPDETEDLDLDASTPTVLRVLRRLTGKNDRPRTEVFDAVMDYVPSAVTIGYLANPDFEIPLPGPDFAEHIGLILTAATVLNEPGPPPQRPDTHPQLPGRPEHTRPADPTAANQTQAARGPRCARRRNRQPTTYGCPGRDGCLPCWPGHQDLW